MAATTAITATKKTTSPTVSRSSSRPRVGASEVAAARSSGASSWAALAGCGSGASWSIGRTVSRWRLARPNDARAHGSCHVHPAARTRFVSCASRCAHPARDQCNRLCVPGSLHCTTAGHCDLRRRPSSGTHPTSNIAGLELGDRAPPTLVTGRAALQASRNARVVVHCTVRDVATSAMSSIGAVRAIGRPVRAIGRPVRAIGATRCGACHRSAGARHRWARARHRCAWR